MRHTRTRTTRTTRTPTRARTHTHTHALSLSLSLFLRQAAAHPNIHKANVTQQLAQRHTDLVHGKVVSNAVAVAHRERDPRIRVNLLVEKALRAEFLWVLPHQRVVVEQQHVQVNWVMVRKGTERKGKERKGKEGKKM